MATITVIGASRGIGLETVKAALARGHTVRAFARSAAAIPLTEARLEKVAGDARAAADVRRAIAGADAVIQAIGLAMGSELLTGTRLFSETTRVLVDAMHEAGPQRLVAVTGMGAGESRDRMGLVYRLAYTVFLQRAYDDKDVQEQMIRASRLDWTIVRPGILLDGPATGKARAFSDPRDWRGGSVRRADVAAFLVTEVETGAYLRQTPLLIE